MIFFFTSSTYFLGEKWPTNGWSSLVYVHDVTIDPVFLYMYTRFYNL